MIIPGFFLSVKDCACGLLRIGTGWRPAHQWEPVTEMNLRFHSYEKKSSGEPVKG